MPSFLEHEEGTLVLVYATPKSSRTEAIGIFDGRLKVTIKAAPVDGAANAELLRYFRKKLGLARGELELLQGQVGRRKTLLVRGQKPDEVRDILLPD